MRLRDDGTPDPETAYDVPPGAPVHECQLCGAPFPSREDRILHRALVHGADDGDGVSGGDEGDEADTRAEAGTLEAAREREETALRRFRLKALGAVVALYFVLLMVYALV